MKYIQKLWYRILISILIGAISSELVVVMFGVKLAKGSSGFVGIFTILAFLVLTIMVHFRPYMYYFFGNKKEAKENREDVLDDLS